MDTIQKLEWSAVEYEEKKRSPDWFWALGVIIAAGAAAAVIFNDAFFAVLLILGGAMLAFFAIKKPDMVNYELGEKGLKMRMRLYPYQNIKSFWVQDENRPTLFIRSERMFMPIISMPIEPSQASQIRQIMLNHSVAEEEMREHPSEHILESLGF